MQHCTVDKQCASNAFCRGRKCVEIAHGSPCPDHVHSRCPSDFYLHSNKSRCYAILAPLRSLQDGHCQDDTDCHSSQYCDPESALCLASKSEDEGCRADSECRRNFKCLPGVQTCAPPCEADWRNCTGSKLCHAIFHGLGYCALPGYDAAEAATPLPRSPCVSPGSVETGPSEDAWKWYWIVILILCLLLLLLIILLFAYFYKKYKKRNAKVVPSCSAAPSPLITPLRQPMDDQADEKSQSEKSRKAYNESPQSKNAGSNSPAAARIRIPSPYIPYMASESLSHPSLLA